jgi:hypothetical protein
MKLNQLKEKKAREYGHLLIWRKKILVDHLHLLHQHLFKVCFILFVKAFLFISQSSVIYPIDHVSNSLIFIQITFFFLERQNTTTTIGAFKPFKWLILITRTWWMSDILIPESTKNKKTKLKQWNIVRSSKQFELRALILFFLFVCLFK